LACQLRAQPAPLSLSAAPKVRSEEALFFELVRMSASLEEVLLGISNLTDAQRDQLEALEAKARDSIAVAAQPLRNGRRANLKGWPSEPDLHEGPLNRIAALRNAARDSARAILGESLWSQFDQNRLKVESVLGVGWLGWLTADDSRWFGYLKAFRGTSSTIP
jgi:hypothetical protein